MRKKVQEANVKGGDGHKREKRKEKREKRKGAFLAKNSRV